MSSEETPKLRPILLVVAAMFAFSLMAVFTRGAATDTLPIATWRAIFVAAVFAIGAVLREGGVSALRPDPTTLRLGAWLGVALAVASTTFVGAYIFTTAANTIFLHNLAPVMVFPLAYWLFEERSGAGAVTGACIALFGVAMLSGVSIFQVSHFASSRFLLGDALALLSAVGYAAVLVLTRMTRRAGTPILGTLFVAWTVAALITVMVSMFAGGFSVPPSSLLWILGLAVFCTNVPFYLLNLGMKHLSAGMAAVLSLSEVLFVTFIGLMLFGEVLAPIGWIGGALAGLGVLYAVTQRGEGESEGDITGQLPDVAVHRTRLLRAGLGLALLNIGAIGAIQGGWSTAPLVTLLGLALLARFGPAAAAVLLDGRFGLAVRGMGACLGVLVAWSASQSAGSFGAADTVGFAVVLLAVLVFERRWSAAEPETVRDAHPVFQWVLAAFALGLIFAGLGHGLSTPLLELANLLVGLCGVIAVLAALAGTGASAHPGMDNLEAPALRWTQGRRPLMLVAGLWLLGAIHMVPAGHVGIVERLGEPVSQTDGAGLALRLPPPIEVVTTVNIGASRQFSIAEQTLLTGDPSMISLAGVVRYSVADAQAFAFGVSDPEAALLSLSRAALVEVVARSDQDALLTTGRQIVESKVLSATQAAADSAGLGVTVSGVHLTEVLVPAPVVASFLDVISANEERQTSINEAEAYAAGLLPRTRGEALASIVGAQGDATLIEAEAVGYDAWFRLVARNGASQRRLTRARIAAEMTEERLRPARLVVAPAGVRVWLDDEGHWPRDPNDSEGR
jgi:membrane protease subunit HflK